MQKKVNKEERFMDMYKRMEDILEQLRQVNSEITKEDIENATKEELERYLELSEEIDAKIRKILEI